MTSSERFQPSSPTDAGPDAGSDRDGAHPGSAAAAAAAAPTPTLQEARRLYRQGRLDQAGRILLPLASGFGRDRADALHLQGIILARQGDSTQAVAHLRAATLAAPDRADLHADLATALLQAGRLSDAEAAWRTAFARAPDRPELHADLAVLLRRQGRLNDAVRHLRTALALKPDFADAQSRLAECLAETGAPAEGLALIRRAVAAQPRRADFRLVLGTVLRRLRRFDAAIDALQTALTLQPNFHAARLNLGHVALVAGRYDLAEAAYGAIPSGVAETAPAKAGLGNTLRVLGRIDAALAAFDGALALAPKDAGIRHNRALTLLTAERYAEGWAAYEARLARPEYARPGPAPSDVRWQGDAPAGKRLLIRAEQGLGDTLQFARFIPPLAGAGAHIVFQVQPSLVRLLQTLSDRCDGRVQVVGSDRAPPQTDAWCPLLSLPHLLGTTPAHLPGPIPYLHPEPSLCAQWQPRLVGNPAPRIGLVWAGNPAVWDDHLRSPGLMPLLPLLEIPGVHFYGLQVGPGRADLQLHSLPPSFHDLGGDLQDAADTAAVMSGLDLIISSCTMTAHLAGGLGRPVWVMLSYSADWRWLRTRSDSPWYPSARLFRQRRPRDWSDVVQEMRDALTSLSRPEP